MGEGTMKNLIILIILGIGGYFAYQYFIGPSLLGSRSAAPAFNIYSLPVKCQGHGESLKDAIARHEISSTINGYTKSFRQCLRDEGYTNAQIDEATDSIRKSR
jgi:hypothetical protein